MRTFLSILGFSAATLVGVAAIGADTSSNVAFIGTGRPDLVAAVVVVAIATAMALTAAGVALRQRQVAMAIGLFVAFLTGAAFSLSATLDRSASTRDMRLQGGKNINARIERSERLLELARADRQKALAGVAAECNGAPAHRKGWPKCRAHELNRDDAAKRIARLEALLAELGTPQVVDSMGPRLAALLPGVTPAHVNTYQPALLPVALFMFGNLLTAFGLGGLASLTRAPRVIKAQAVEILDPVERVLQHERSALTNRQLAQLAGVSEAKAHRTVKALEDAGRVHKRRDGRAMRIRLVA